MEVLNLREDLKVLGVEVKTFPIGIGEAFDKLVNMFPGEFDRSCYGVSYTLSNNRIIYKAGIDERHEGESEKYNCERYIIEKGKYLAVTIKEWRKKVDSINDIFMKMLQDPRIEPNKLCVEWYKDDDEMICMIKLVE